jgi:hypothetical protein
MSRLGFRMIPALALLAGAAAPAQADWNSYGGNVEKTFFTTEKVQAPLGVVWKHSTSVYSERGGNRSGPVISEGMAFFASKNRMYCVDQATGELKWRAPEGDPNDPKIPQITATPVVANGFVYTPDANGIMTAYTVDEGQPAWQFKTGGAIYSSPILVGNTLYFGSDDDFLYALNAQSGDLVWKSNERGKPMPLSDDAKASPCYYNGVVYINSSDMKLWAFQADTGRLIWQSRVGAPSIDISPVANNGRVYLAAGSTMYQFRLRGGQSRAFPLQEWVGNDITTTPIVTEKFWFFGDRDGFFHAFTAAGRPAKNVDGQDWKVKLEGRPQGTPVMTSDTIYVTTDKGFVFGLDLAKGKVTWTYRTEAPKGMTPAYLYYAIRAPLAVSDGKLFVLGDDGTLTAMAADAADDEGPILSTPRPSRGAVMNGSPPVYFSVYLWDEGSGINPDTLEVLLDGRPIDMDPEPYNRTTGSAPRKGWTYDPVRRVLRYQTLKAERGEPEQPLLNGRHKVQVQAGDWRGNFSSLEWTFVVDNSLPRNAVATRPRTTNQPGSPGAPGGYPGGEGSPGAPGGYGSPGSPGAPGSPGMGGGRGFNSRFGGYGYGNRGQGGYGFGQGQGGAGGRPGFGGRPGAGGGRPGFGGSPSF